MTELQIMVPSSIANALRALPPPTDCSLSIETDIAATLVDHILKGRRFDVFVGPPFQVNRLVAADKLDGNDLVPVAHSGIGVAVKAGAPTPDVTSMAGFREALLKARSVAYLKQAGTSGAYIETLLERLDLADALEPKISRLETDTVCQAVATGEVELGIVVIPQIMTTPGVALAGPLPEPIQRQIQWIGGVSPTSRQRRMAMGVLKAFSALGAASVLRAQGLEPN